MKNLALIFVAAAFITSCATLPEKATQRFQNPHTSMELEVKLFDSQAALDNYAKTNYPKVNRTTSRKGMAIWPVIQDNQTHKCVILVPRFQYGVSSATEIYGHEILHCIYGQYHQ
jgi:hypothetical protein